MSEWSPLKPGTWRAASACWQWNHLGACSVRLWMRLAWKGDISRDLRLSSQASSTPMASWKLHLDLSRSKSRGIVVWFMPLPVPDFRITLSCLCGESWFHKVLKSRCSAYKEILTLAATREANSCHFSGGYVLTRVRITEIVGNLFSRLPVVNRSCCVQVTPILYFFWLSRLCFFLSTQRFLLFPIS